MAYVSADGTGRNGQDEHEVVPPLRGNGAQPFITRPGGFRTSGSYFGAVLTAAMHVRELRRLAERRVIGGDARLITWAQEIAGHIGALNRLAARVSGSGFND